MADLKITQLVDGGAPQATDEFVIARAGDNFKVDWASLDSSVDLSQAVILAPASSARNVIQPTAGAVIAAIVKAHAAQSVDLTQWQDSAGGVLVSVGPTGAVTISPSTDVAPLSITGAVGLTSSLLDVFNSGGYGFSVSKDGSFVVDSTPSANSALLLIGAAAVPRLSFTNGTLPPDAFFGAGQIGLWWDATNGAAKFMLKGKTLDGTVVTWAIPNGVVYVAGGTDVALADGGTGASLVDPNADRIFFWDDSAGSTAFLTPGTGLTITGTTIDATAGAPTGATYITQTPDAGLSAEQALSALATGLVKNTTGTGVLSIGAQGTDYYAPGGTDVAVADGGTGSSTAAGARTNLDVPSNAEAVLDTLFDANTVLAADTDNTPAAVTMAASTILARLAAGNIKAASVAEIITLLQAYTVGGTDVAVADGGTGASTAATARTNLGVPAMRRPTYRVGQYYYGELIAQAMSAAAAPSAARAFYVPFIVDVTTTFDRIAVYLTVNGSAGALYRMGIYNDGDGDPGTVLLDAGTVATDAGAASIKSITISQQLTPGKYWLCSVAQTAAATVRRGWPLQPGGFLHADFNSVQFILDGVTGALGNDPGVSIASDFPPIVALRVASSP